MLRAIIWPIAVGNKDRPLHAWTRHASMAGFVLACACNVYDPKLNPPPVRNEPDASGVSSRDDSVKQAGAADGGDLEPASGSCPPAVARMRGGCSSDCRELCNDRDDDCDGTADEASADASCGAPHADAICRQGICLLTGCRDDHRDCDQLPENGCEIGPDDAQNCGVCGHRCETANASRTCHEGQCSLTACQAGFADCDGDGAACETALDTASDCGACGRACAAPAHARARCVDGVCASAGCDDGHADCNGRSEDGCEQALDTLEHCGGCDVACRKATCRGGVCTAADCSRMPGWADCDGDEASCETDLTSDPASCGSCGTVCPVAGETPHGQPKCQAGKCRTACDSGYADCDGEPANGCEQPLNTLAHCGACDRPCMIADATEQCAASRCSVAVCNADFADCDADGTSCETTLNTTRDCGACGVQCALPQAIQTCAGAPGQRACAINGCEPDWSDCDGLAANGCERDVRDWAVGGQGPCLPAPDCVAASRDGHDYFVCPSARTWQAARATCQGQVGGDLAVIESASEAAFVRTRLRRRHWIGHSDLNVEGLWIWARTGVPFWRGGEWGSTVDAAYARWADDEPRGLGDCGALDVNGLFDELSCSTNQPFVCEVSPDVCPEDFAKLDPGQCGCGRLETDSDGDGFADCWPVSAR